MMQIKKYSYTSALDDAMLDHKQTGDDHSTSAGGSDSEADAKDCLLESWEDDFSDSETKDATYDRSTLLRLRTVAEQPKGDKSLPRGTSCIQAASLCSKSLPNAGTEMPLGIAPPPGLPLPSNLGSEDIEVAVKPKVFSAVAFRKELVVVLRELTCDKNVGVAVQRVRDQVVPESDQAEQFMDIISRAVDEKICANRRLYFAFATGLVKAEKSAFEKSECATGLIMFFQEVYEELVAEVPRVKSIVAHELLPALRSAIPEKELSNILPPDIRALQNSSSTRKVMHRRA